MKLLGPHSTARAGSDTYRAHMHTAVLHTFLLGKSEAQRNTLMAYLALQFTKPFTN